MAINLAGMFANLGAATQGIGESVMGGPLPKDYRDRNAMQRAGVTNPMLQMFGQGLGGAMGADMRSQNIQGQEKLGQALMESDPTKQMELARGLINSGFAEQGATLFQKAQAKLQEQQTREVLAKQAKKLGLTELSESLLTSQTIDVKAAQKEIFDRETALAAARGGRKGRQALARQFGKDTEFLAEIGKGEYDEMSDEAFSDLLQGREADAKAFLNPMTDKAEIFKVDKSGNVWDEESKTWVTPSSLGLTAAPQVQKVFNAGNKLTEALVGKGVDRFDTLVNDAANAQKTLAAIRKSRRFIAEGVNTGVLANLQTGAGKVAALLGFEADDSARTEQLVINQMQFMSDLIRDYGAGTGISNFDVQNVMTRIAADPTLFEETIVDVLNSMEEIALHVQDKYKVVADELIKKEGIDPSVLAMFKIPERGPNLDNTSPNTQGTSLRQKYNLPE